MEGVAAEALPKFACEGAGETVNQQKRQSVKVVVRPQTEDEAGRFAVAANLLLADIVRKVLEKKLGTVDEESEPTGQTLHRAAPLQ